MRSRPDRPDGLTRSASSHLWDNRRMSRAGSLRGGLRTFLHGLGLHGLGTVLPQRFDDPLTPPRCPLVCPITPPESNPVNAPKSRQNPAGAGAATGTAIGEAVLGAGRGRSLRLAGGFGDGLVGGFGDESRAKYC